MEDDESRIAEHIRKNPPSCVANFRLSPAELPGLRNVYFITIYNLACRCGSAEGGIYGYPLRDYNAKYIGPDFITPLSFKCGTCGIAEQIIDTNVHGYHAEVSKLEGGTGSAKLRGSGEPSPFSCPNCAGAVFSTIVGFNYWDFDLMFDEPELPAQEFFNEFLIYGTCKKCGKATAVTHLGKL